MFRGCLSNKEINCKTRKLQRKRKQNKITYKLGEITYLIWGRNPVICSDFWGRNSDSSHREHVSKLDWRKGEACHVSRAEWRKRAGTGQNERQLSRAERNWAWHAVTRDPPRPAVTRGEADWLSAANAGPTRIKPWTRAGDGVEETRSLSGA